MKKYFNTGSVILDTGKAVARIFWGREYQKQRSHKICWTDNVRRSGAEKIARKDYRQQLRSGENAELRTLAATLGIEI